MRAVSVLALLLSTSAHGGIIINEVMSNEPGRETSLEWIELWNFSDSLSSLDGFTLINGDHSTTFTDFGVTLPYEFLVLVRDSDRFETYYGDSSGVWGDGQDEDFRIVLADMSLRNSGDTIELRDALGVVVARCTWKSTAPDGVSIERYDPRDADSAAIWNHSVSDKGSTPGRHNSISPGFDDLELAATFVISGTQRNQLDVEVLIRNVGLGVSNPNRLTIGIDLNDDGDFGTDEIIAEQVVPQLELYDSIAVSAHTDVDDGRHSVIVFLEPDDMPQNNSISAVLRFGIGVSEVVINEILPDPDVPLESEWIELLNVSHSELDLTGWSICDASSCTDIDSIRLLPGEYLVLCQDKAAFDAFYPDVDAQTAIPATWRSLNNTGDTVFILDDTGAMVDSMFYFDVYGGNVSIERIDPQAIGYDLSNWYRSTAPECSTPGSPNSVVEGFVDESSVWLESKLISPDGDGQDDILAIRYDLAKGAALTLKVFDLDGNLVRTILDGAFLTSGEYEYDGTADDGNKLDVGMYLILAEISGKVGTQRKLVFAVVGD